MFTVQQGGQNNEDPTGQDTSNENEGNPNENEGNKKQTQVISGTASYKKVVDDAAFYLDAKSDGTGPLVYTSDNTRVADVSDEGLVTIKGAGTAVISVLAQETTYWGSSEPFYVTVTVDKKAQSVTGTGAYTKRIGDSFVLSTAKTGDGTLVFSSSNSNIATVTSAGIVDIKAAGTAVISVYAQETPKSKISNVLKITITALKKEQAVTVTSSYRKAVGAGAFKLSAKTSGNGTLKFSSNNKSVATVDSKGTVKVKNIGIAKITVYAAESTTCLKSAAKTITIKVVPKKMSLSSVKFKSKGKATVKWAKQSGISGYEIQYSVKSNFSKAKTVKAGSSTVSKVLSGLVNKATYYVRIRSYKTVSGEKLYSDWSSAKKVKIKSGAVKSYKKKPSIKVTKISGEFRNKISWSKLSNAAGYEVYVKKGEKGKWTKIGTTKSTSLEHSVTHGVWYFYKVRAYQELAEGTRLTGPYSAEKKSLHYYKPNFTVWMSSETDPSAGLFALVINNRGQGTMRIYSRNASLLDSDYTNFNRKLYLSKSTTGYVDLGEASYMDIKPGEEKWAIFLTKEGNTWYDAKSMIFYDFRYDGVDYRAYSSSSYGTDYYR